jgi:hypothetical protein
VPEEVGEMKEPEFDPWGIVFFVLGVVTGIIVIALLKEAGFP